MGIPVMVLSGASPCPPNVKFGVVVIKFYNFCMFWCLFLLGLLFFAFFGVGRKIWTGSRRRRKHRRHGNGFPRAPPAKGKCKTRGWGAPWAAPSRPTRIPKCKMRGPGDSLLKEGGSLSNCLRKMPEMGFQPSLWADFQFPRHRKMTRNAIPGSDWPESGPQGLE